MLFDLRGRRKNAIRVVYAVLAVLMGASLFLVVGGFNLAEILGTGGGSGSAEEVLDDQAERIEGRLARNPKDEGMLLALTRARINAGNAQIEVSPEGAPQPIPTEAREDFDLAREAWERYLQQAGDNPNPAVAQLIATTYFTVAERGATGFNDIEESIDTAVAAQQIAADEQPNVNSLSTLAIYQYFNADFAGGDRAKEEAVKLAVSKEEEKAIEGQLAGFRKRAKQFNKQRQQLAKEVQRAGGEQPETAPSPFGLPTPGE